jgi:hypothetical protein
MPEPDRDPGRRDVPTHPRVRAALLMFAVAGLLIALAASSL